METRKVQFTGNSTFTISLPKDWIDKMGIKRGDVVGLVRDNRGTITITPSIDARKDYRSKIINLQKESPAHLERMLIGTYIMGFDTIIVRAKERIDNAVKEKVRQFTRSVTGVEIVEETINSVTIKDLSDPMELSQEKGVRRLHLIVRSMAVDAMDAFQKGDQPLAVDVINRDSDADRIYWIIMKEHNMMTRDPRLAERLKMTIEESTSYFQIARYLERIGDHGVQIARAVTAITDYAIPKELMHKFELAHGQALKMLDGSISAYFKGSAEDANDVIDGRDNLKTLLREISMSIQKIKAEEAVQLALIEESVRRIAYYATDISEVTINYCMLTDK